MNNIVIHNSFKSAQNYIMNDINDTRLFPLHEQSWYRTALLNIQRYTRHCVVHSVLAQTVGHSFRNMDFKWFKSGVFLLHKCVIHYFTTHIKTFHVIFVHF